MDTRRLAYPLSFLYSGLLSAESVFIQAQKISLKAMPSMSAAETGALVRGEEVTLLETQGTWLQVQKGESKGWVSKLFVGKSKPIGAASLAKEVPASDAKTSRRRESSYSVSASTRGLMPVERSRNGRESYRADNKALEAVDHFTIPSQELESFISASQPSKK